MNARPFGAGGPAVPVIGQGTWKFPTHGHAVAEAHHALRAGIELGLTHIDTAEMYGDGRSEEIIGEAIRGLPRESLFIVSKVLPSNATYEGTLRACDRSLKRLRVDHLDAYLLHWRGDVPLAETMRAFEELVDAGKISHLGVSNFLVDDLDEARAALSRHPIACNQICYNLGEREPENDVIPYCQEHGIAVVGYTPFGRGPSEWERGERGAAVREVALKHGVTSAAVVLAFLVRLDGTFTIPKAVTADHLAENASAGAVVLSPEDVQAIDAAFRASGPARRYR